MRRRFHRQGVFYLRLKYDTIITSVASLREGKSMSIRNCPECGKVFVPIGGINLCPDCKKIEEEDYDKVYKYVRQNPGATIDKVAEDTSVVRKKVVKFLKEGRLKGTQIASDELRCISCGAPIPGGKVCSKCAVDFDSKLKPREQKPEREPEPHGKVSGAMHSYNDMMKRRRET